MIGTTASRRGSRSRRSARLMPRGDLLVVSHDGHTRRPAGTAPVTRTALRAAELLFLGAIPLLAVALSIAAYAGDDRLALDFHTSSTRRRRPSSTVGTR